MWQETSIHCRYCWEFAGQHNSMQRPDDTTANPLAIYSNKISLFSSGSCNIYHTYSGCIKILMGNPVAEGTRLKDWMIMAMTVPNFYMFFAMVFQPL